MNPSSNTGVANFPAGPAAQPYIAAAVNAVANGSWTIVDSSFYPTWVPNDPSVQRFGMVFAGEAPVPEPRDSIRCWYRADRALLPSPDGFTPEHRFFLGYDQV